MRHRGSAFSARLVVLFFFLFLVVASSPAVVAAGEGPVVVNGRALDTEVVRALERAYGVRIAPGRYWYDRVSGLWGFEGGPNQGQILPGLELGGPLDWRASGGWTAVVVNGRALHPTEVAHLQQRFGAVMPGRYWLNARGWAGYEGGPPQWNLAAGASAGRRSLLGHSVTGSVIGGGGDTVGYIGGGVGITCGPDGGCF